MRTPRRFYFLVLMFTLTCLGELVSAMPVETENATTDGQLSSLLATFQQSPEKRGDILHAFRVIVARRGLPSVYADGAGEVNAIGPLIIASSDDYPFQEHLLDLLSDRIGVDINAQALAVLADEVNYRHDGTQLFGSLLCDDDGEVKTCPLITAADANPLRDQFGLDMLDEYIKDAREALRSGQKLDDFIFKYPLAMRPETPSDPRLAGFLKKMFQEDQLARKSGNHTAVVRTDAAHLPILKNIFTSHGFPNASQVGRSGVLHFFVLVDHADKDPDFQMTALRQAKHLLGAGGLRRQDYATLCDRIRVNQGLKQIYGTQVEKIGGHYKIRAVADPGKLDRRRISMGLLPAKQYLKMLEESSADSGSGHGDAK